MKIFINAAVLLPITFILITMATHTIQPDLKFNSLRSNCVQNDLQSPSIELPKGPYKVATSFTSYNSAQCSTIYIMKKS